MSPSLEVPLSQFILFLVSNSMLTGHLLTQILSPWLMAMHLFKGWHLWFHFRGSNCKTLHTPKINELQWHGAYFIPIFSREKKAGAGWWWEKVNCVTYSFLPLDSKLVPEIETSFRHSYEKPSCKKAGREPKNDSAVDSLNTHPAPHPLTGSERQN